MHDFPVCLFNPAFRGCQNPINGLFVTPVNTQDRTLPLRDNCFNPTPSHRSLICYWHWNRLRNDLYCVKWGVKLYSNSNYNYWHWTLFFQLILHVDVVLYCVVPPNCSSSRIWLFIYITLTFFSVLSPSHCILALWQSCALSTAVLINEYERYGIVCLIMWCLLILLILLNIVLLVWPRCKLQLQGRSPWHRKL